jgi:hypothetical protein
MKTIQLEELIKSLEELRDENKLRGSTEVIFDSDEGWQYIHQIDLDDFKRVRIS